MGVLQTKWIIKAIQRSSSIYMHLMHVVLRFIKQNTCLKQDLNTWIKLPKLLLNIGILSCDMFLSNSLIDSHCLGIIFLVSSFAGYHVSTKTNCDSKRNCRLRVLSISWQVQERKPSPALTGKIHIKWPLWMPTDTTPQNCNWGLSALPTLAQAIKAIAFKLQEAGNCFMQKDLESIM